jgi:hypothetical protein
MTVFGWLVVGLGVAVVGWLVYRMNQTTPGETTSYQAAKPKVAEKVAPVAAKTAEKKTAHKAPAKKPAAKKTAKK